MKQEFFTARLLQIQLEMEAVKSEIAGMTSENLFRATIGHDLTHDQGVLFGLADQLRALQGDIKALMEEYSKGEETPAAGKKERLYTLNEMHRCYMQGREFHHIPEADGFAEANFEGFIDSLEGAGE